MEVLKKIFTHLTAENQLDFNKSKDKVFCYIIKICQNTKEQQY